MAPDERQLQDRRDAGDGDQVSVPATDSPAPDDQTELRVQIERSGLPCEALAPDQGFVVTYADFRVALRQDHEAILASLVVGDLPAADDRAALRQLLRWAKDVWLEAGLSLAGLADGRIMLSGVIRADGEEETPELIDQLDAVVAMATRLRSQIVLTLMTEDTRPADSTTSWLRV